MAKGKKILVATQNSQFLYSFGDRLARYNYCVRGTRATDEELFKTLTEVNPDLTILDAPVSSMNGIRQLLSIRDTFDMPILMLSTQGAKADTVQTLNISSFSHPSIKPLTFEQLTLQINQLLNTN
jgi:DNA-binding response OmpR family regulator